MLKTFAVALLATAMSVGLAEAKGHMAKPKAPAPCQKGRKHAPSLRPCARNSPFT